VQDDEAVLQKLEAALAAGPDPELDVLTKVHYKEIFKELQEHTSQKQCSRCCFHT
jgi:hypothetical protein